MEPTKTEIVVLGAGPGGYAAAFYAADLGKKVTLIERDPKLGGVCLNRGCIPSKALLHAAHTIEDARAASAWGITFAEPQIDLAALRTWKGRVVDRLTRGLGSLGKQRQVRYVQGRGQFADAHTLHVRTADEVTSVTFDYAIVATGSLPAAPQALRLIGSLAGSFRFSLSCHGASHRFREFNLLNLHDADLNPPRVSLLINYLLQRLIKFFPLCQQFIELGLSQYIS